MVIKKDYGYQKEYFDRLVEKGFINTPEYWLNNWNEYIKVKDVMVLIEKLYSRP